METNACRQTFSRADAAGSGGSGRTAMASLRAHVQDLSVGPNDEPVDGDDMDPREDDPDKLHGPHRERRDEEIRRAQ